MTQLVLVICNIIALFTKFKANSPLEGIAKNMKEKLEDNKKDLNNMEKELNLIK